MRYCEKSVRETAKSNREILRVIYDNMMKYRKRDKVVFRPYTHLPEVDVIYNNPIKFSEIYPEAKEGDYVYVSYYADGIFEKDMHINIQGNKQAEVYFNGEKKQMHPFDLRGTDSIEADVTFREGKNLVIVRIPAQKDSFEAAVRNLLPGLHMGADGYVYNTKCYIEADGFFRQEGRQFSRLYKKDEPVVPEFEKIEWVYPVKPQQSDVKEFDFTELCGADGHVAYIYTEFRGSIKIEHNSPIKIFSGKKVLYYGSGDGSYEADFVASVPLLIKCLNEKGKWQLKVTEKGEAKISFIEADNCSDLHWMWIGPFGRSGEPMEYPYIPEYKNDFKEPMVSVCGKTVYWRFYRKDTYLRQYLQTAFWGQWFYAIMVGLEGMRQTAAKLGISEFYEYFTSFMETVCVHREYGKHDRAIYGWTSYMPNASHFNNLDSIGSFGMCISEYYMMTGDNKAKTMLEILADSIMHNIPRFPDGTYNRVKTMWTDDMYMCLPFLVRLGLITGEEKYFDEAAKQIFGFYDRMYMKDQDIYSHIYFPPQETPNRIPWGRGNGWVMVAVSEVLMHMPKAHKDYGRILEIFRSFAKGVLNCRDKKEKIWHQVINNHDSYIETSGSAMFITGLARGVKYGWLDENIKSDVVDAWEGLTQKCIDSEGNVYGVCMGSNCSMDEQYYINLGTITNDDHGVGIVLAAGVAVMNMLDE